MIAWRSCLDWRAAGNKAREVPTVPMSACVHRNRHRLDPRHFQRLAAIMALLLVLGMGAAACSSPEAGHSKGKAERGYSAADVAANRTAALPSYVTADMRDGYEYALAHPEQLQYMPCYCGCGMNAGHKSNLECYIAGVDENGTAVFDNHASFCAVCLEITRDAKRLSAAGKPLKEIRAYVDQTHGEKGPGTDTPQPPS